MKLFKNKVAVITGAASGIGKGIAEQCAWLDMKLVLADIDAPALTALEVVLKERDIEVEAVVTDVSIEADVKNLLKRTVERFGRADLLFNNAGVAAGGPLWESSPEDCQWVVDVNLMGMMHCIRAFVPVMLDQDSDCHIVNTSSVTGTATYHPSALYHITKHGILAMSEQLYHDLRLKGAKIGVSVLCPGFVDTRIMDAERNRPARYRNTVEAASSSPHGEKMEAAFREMIASGMSPDKVAEITLDAVKNDRFYIFTHPDLMYLARERMNALMEMKNPILPPFTE